MELQLINNHEPIVTAEVINPVGLKASSDRCFIEANTVDCSFEEIKNDHIIPVFIKDNEPLISHSDFINTTMDAVQDFYRNETILSPNLRVSHPIKGRVPNAKNKAANELLEHEKTLYFERMAFIIEIPSITDEIDGNVLSLMVGGVKSFSLDNLYGKTGSDQHFKLFIGYKNKVCTNLCVWSDGFKSDVKVTTLGGLKGVVNSLIEQYNSQYHLFNMRSLVDYSITETQFATLIGKLRMYPHLSKDMQQSVPPLYFGDGQINTVVKDYFKDTSFCRDDNGNINLWRLYNLLTGANKSSYIDQFIDRSVNAFDFTERLKQSLLNKTESWFLN